MDSSSSLEFLGAADWRNPLFISLGNGFFYFFLGFFLLLPASDIAIAMLCFSGRPDFLSSEMLAEIVFCDEPFLSGI